LKESNALYKYTVIVL